MRRLALALAFSCVAFMFGAGPAAADGGPHRSGQGTLADGCAGCHRLHTAKTAQLTKDPQPQLCYTCHDGTTADTDVIDGMNGAGAGLRGGGFEYALLDSANAESMRTTVPAAANKVGVLDPAVAEATRSVTSSHQVDGTDATAWGMGAIGSGAGETIQLRCGSCHDPHGNGNYRILRPMPEQGQTGLGTSTPVVPFGGAIADETTKNYTTANYWLVGENGLGATAAPSATGFVANVGQWCSQCHTRYLATGASASNVAAQQSKVNSGDDLFTFRHTSSGTAPSSKGTGYRNCIQCHVAHGTNAKMTGRHSSEVGNPAGGDVGDSKLLRVDNRGTCKMCHTEGNTVIAPTPTPTPVP